MLRWNPGCEWDFERREKKFEEMARKGWVLSKYREFSSTYAHESPLDVKYKIFLEQKSPSEDEVDKYAPDGWLYVDHYDSFSVYRSMNRDTPNLHITREGLINIIRKIKNRRWTDLMVNFLILVIYSVVLGVISTDNLAGIINIRINIFEIFTPYIIIVIASILRLVYTCSLLRKMYAGEFENDVLTSQKKKKNLRAYTVITWLNKCTYFIFIVFIIINTYKYNSDKTYSPSRVPIPMISLVDIETSPNYVPYGLEEASWYFNDYQPHIHPLTSMLFLYNEGSSSLSSSPKSGPYMPTLQVKYYKFIFENLADLLMEQQLTQACDESYQETAAQETEYYDSIHVFTNKNSSDMLLITKRGKEVMLIKYSGQEDYTRLIDVLDQRARKL